MEKPDTGELVPGHGLRLGYYAQEHETLDPDATVWENIRHAAPDAGAQELRNLLGSFMFTGEQLDQPAGTLSGGEKTRLALAGLVSSRRERAAARRADQQPRPGQPGAGAGRAAPLRGRRRAGHARSRRGRGA